MSLRTWINGHPKVVLCVASLSFLALLGSYFIVWRLPGLMAKREQKERRHAAAEQHAKLDNPVVKGKLVFEGSMMRVKEPSGYIQPLPQHTTTLKCGDSLDVMWSEDSVLFMKTKGIFERTLVAKGVHFSDLEWDGQYIWVAVPEEGIWIVDTAGQVVSKISPEAGLPPAEKGLLLHLMERGKVFATGSFGPHARGWCAVVEFKEGKALVNVFHEATRVPAETDDSEDIRTDPSVVFTPYWIRENEPEGHRMLYIARCEQKYSNQHVLRYPLEINLDSLSVRVSSTPMNSISVPQPKLVYEGKIYVPGRIWYRIDPNTGERETLVTQGTLPDPYASLQDFWVSAHYGLAGWWKARGLYQIRITDEERVIVDRSPPPHPPEVTTKVPEKEYFHTFAFEDANGPIADPNKLRLVHLEIHREGKPPLEYKHADYEQRKLLPTGMYKPWQEVVDRRTAKSTKSYAFTPIEVTEKSPEHLVFKIPPPVPTHLIMHGRVVDAVTSKPLSGAFVMAGSDRNLVGITADEWLILHKLPMHLSHNHPALDPVRRKDVFPIEAITRTGPEGRFELRVQRKPLPHQIVAFEQDYLRAVLDRSDFTQAENGRIDVGLMPLFPAAKVRVHTSIDKHGNDKLETGTVTMHLVVAREGYEDSRAASVFFNMYRVNKGVRIPSDRADMDSNDVYHVPAGFSLRLCFQMPYDPAWALPNIPQVVDLKQGEILDLGKFVFEPLEKVSTKVVNSNGLPIPDVYIKNLNQQAGYYGVSSRTSHDGIAQVYLQPDSRQEILIDFSSVFADLTHTLLLDVSSKEKMAKGFTIVLSKTGGIGFLQTLEPTEAQLASLQQSGGQPGDTAAPTAPKLDKTVFAAGLDANNSPVNDLKQISINHGRLYIYTYWQLPLEYHEAVIKLFDDSGKLLKEFRQGRVPYNSAWRFWAWYDIDTAKDKPGKWKAEVYLDGKKYAEEYLTVLP